MVTMKNKLILVEGLTGTGKSILAHFIARQLKYAEIDCDWLHEGELDHPLAVEEDAGMDRYMTQTLARWRAFAGQIEFTGQLMVVEASFLNNLVETLMIENVQNGAIFDFVETLHRVIAPLNPVLLYLFHEDTARALARNFEIRGEKFRDFVIDFVESTPYALEKGYRGYGGMVHFWEDFAALTDQVYERFPFQKFRLDTTGGDWERVHKRALAALQVPFTREPEIRPELAFVYSGLYHDLAKDRQFEVIEENGSLYINFFHTVQTRLIPLTDTLFAAAGWHFEITFEEQSSGEVRLKFGGEDIDYLKLVGTKAVRQSAEKST